MAGAVIGKGGHNIQKLRTEVCIDMISRFSSPQFPNMIFTSFFCYHFLFLMTKYLKKLSFSSSPFSLSFLHYTPST